MSFIVAVVGATGGVGAEVISILSERGFPVEELLPLVRQGDDPDAVVDFAGDSLPVRPLSEAALKKADIAIFCTPAEVGRAYAPKVAAAGGAAIDLSPAFRDDPRTPLVVPEVNAAAIGGAFAPGGSRIVASPGAISTSLAVALSPLREPLGLTRVIASAYVSASGAGKRGLDELHEQAVALLNARDSSSEVFGAQVAFNVLPEVPARGGFDDEGASGEERGISREAARLLGGAVEVTASAAYVPTFVGHAVAVYAEGQRELPLSEARAALRSAPSVLVADELEPGRYPTVVSAAGEDAVWIGRLRRPRPNALWLFLAVDNLRKGSALNAVQIAELIARDHAGALHQKDGRA